jgi:transcriptional regulator with GAF, ATPase, and Fis domain
MFSVAQNETAAPGRLEFFHKFILSLSSSPDIGEALKRTWDYLKKIMDCDALSVHIEEQGTSRIIAVAGYTDLFPGHLAPPLSFPLPANHDVVWEEPDDVVMIGNFRSKPVYHGMIRRMEITEASSCIIVKIPIDGVNRGSLWIWSRKAKVFSRDESSLFSSIRQPLAYVVSAYLKGREQRKRTGLMDDDSVRFPSSPMACRKDIGNDTEDVELAGKNRGLRPVMKQIMKVAKYDCPVLLYGETGVGKEEVAKTIHRYSGRNKGPFIKVNCGAIPETLIDSELFGHEKGAFTGASSDHLGRFERAQNGTIFLDEISEMPLMAQTRLLHVLQSGEIERVGGTRSLRINTRVIAATNRDLKKMIGQNTFRMDLWYRLNVFQINIPPVRNRKEDIRELVDYFIQKKCVELDIFPVPEINPADLAKLLEYDWPGNVREIKNIVERALIDGGTGALDMAGHIDHCFGTDAEPSREPAKTASSLNDSISETIRKALILTKGKISGEDGAARMLNTHPSTLRNKIKKLGINIKGIK